jgi:anaerobic ribonucleoside-triphosphate reductase
MKTHCDVFSRIVDYLRPISNWNEGKAEEFKDRKLFSISNNIQEGKNGKT